MISELKYKIINKHKKDCMGIRNYESYYWDTPWVTEMKLKPCPFCGEIPSHNES